MGPWGAAGSVTRSESSEADSRNGNRQWRSGMFRWEWGGRRGFCPPLASQCALAGEEEGRGQLDWRRSWSRGDWWRRKGALEDRLVSLRQPFSPPAAFCSQRIHTLRAKKLWITARPTTLLRGTPASADRNTPKLGGETLLWVWRRASRKPPSSPFFAFSRLRKLLGAEAALREVADLIEIYRFSARGFGGSGQDQSGFWVGRSRSSPWDSPQFAHT
mmetsp:Transcript_17535/g.44141  ORF Transcript_17535/g.44141 Transcript_17535/m.44141 type:complete len:217 (+) Transcript_17535:1564-2214(+)